MRGRCIACSPRSAAPSSSARPRARGWHLLPAGHGGVSLGARLVSLVLLIAAWYAGSQLAGARLLPDPQAVALAIIEEARSGALAFNLGATLARVAIAFAIAMALGSVIGLVMGRSRSPIGSAIPG